MRGTKKDRSSSQLYKSSRRPHGRGEWSVPMSPPEKEEVESKWGRGSREGEITLSSITLCLFWYLCIINLKIIAASCCNLTNMMKQNLYANFGKRVKN